MNLLRSALATLLLLVTVQATGVAPGQIKNFVTFGDSYTDIVSVGDGGTAWPVYASGYANISLFPFAKSGATCSNNLTNRPFPSVFESQLPTYFEETSNGTLKLKPEETTSGKRPSSALLTGDDAASLVDVTTCMVNWVKVLYESGARNFVFQNINPLQHTILYSSTGYYTKFWTFPRNATSWSVSMTELALSGNDLTQLKLQALLPQIPDAHVAHFDSHSLFQDMFDNPSQYLNGTAPLNVTGCINSCVFQVNEPDSGVCTLVNGTDRDSYLWYDELHPSEQADRIVARERALVMEGKTSKWATWLS
ncbi:carbohydrate esterase family 16 protein [Lentinula edodes]|uniref:Carbohydrate esterase family 16 protein n=1 Tax=Lentinula lateritia TaxID=40482 RepID=A0A9W9AX43_9AGAR|nr:carbohydrate esterase family 16 protein [Lentinula edodes]